VAKMIPVYMVGSVYRLKRFTTGPIILSRSLKVADDETVVRNCLRQQPEDF
jgi:hypothetical protein